MYLSAHKNLPFPATTPPDQVKTVKLELDRTVVKEEFARENIEATMTGVSSRLQTQMFPFVCTYEKCSFVTPTINPHNNLVFHLMEDHGYGEDEAEGYILRVQRPYLPRECGVKQFNSFKLDWDKFSEQYKSRY